MTQQKLNYNMLITKEVEIIVNSVVVPYFRNLGYITGKNQKLVIPIEHLNKGSHSIVDVKCDLCGCINKIPYKVYLKLTEYDGNYYCRVNKCFLEKTKKTNMDKYNVIYTSNLKEKQDKWKQTNLEKYGFENVFQNEEIKEKIRQYYRDNFNGAEWNTQIKEVRDKNGWIPDENLIGFTKYLRIVRRLTNRNKKELMENWDGIDYYDNEYIRDNFNLKNTNKNYPTIDHKISLKYGYINTISEEQIASIDNLCITKRYINSSKHSRTEDEYKLLKSKP